jgi:hypothetical protein
VYIVWAPLYIEEPIDLAPWAILDPMLAILELIEAVLEAVEAVLDAPEAALAPVENMLPQPFASLISLRCLGHQISTE